MTDSERQLREELDQSRFQNKVLTWLGAFLLVAWLITVVYLR